MPGGPPAEVSGYDERWRFKPQQGARVAPPVAALHEADVLEDIETWRCVWSARMSFREHIHLIKARSVLGLVRHLAKDSNIHGLRVAACNDNLGAVLAFSKGRCASYGLFRILRRTFAVLLAKGIRLYVPCIPSKLNTADEAFRTVPKKQLERRDEWKFSARPQWKQPANAM